MCRTRRHNYDDCEPYDIVSECSDYEEVAIKMEGVSTSFAYLLNMLYGTIPYDRHGIEFSLAEIADYLDVKLPDSPLAILPNRLHPIN